MPELSVSTASAHESLLSLQRQRIPGWDSWRSRAHLLNTNDLSREEVDCLVKFAAVCKKLLSIPTSPLSFLQNKTVATVFYENSTRTRSSFERAARQLGATVINLDVQSSSVAKGETHIDTGHTLASMGVNAIVQRHSSSGSAHQLAAALGTAVHVLNAGDGWNAHPTQGLLDLFTMIESAGNLKGAKVAIIGDITHSRVARSNIWLLKLFGADVHLSGPPTLIPADVSQLGVTVHNRLEPAIEQADFVMVLRMQLERQKRGLIPSIGEYKKLYRLDHNRLNLAKPEAKVMHPGPANRGLEITDELASDPVMSLVSTQVTNGVAVRMAVLYLLLADKETGS